MNVDQLIDKGIPFLTTTQSVKSALKIFTNYGFSQLPLTSSGDYLGLVKIEELKNYTGDIETLTAVKLQKDVYIKPQDNILEAIRISQNFQIEILPVVDSNLKYIGSVKMDTCWNYLIKNTTLGEIGGILVLKGKRNDYSFSEISRIIEMEGFNLLHFFINDYDETTQELKITIKVDSLNLESLERTFERYGYLVDAIFTEKDNMGGLKERYDSLMTYLNV
jgi:predicted transcriptional regulator